MKIKTIKIFLITLVLQFVMSVLLRLNISTNGTFDFLKLANFKLASPVAETKNSVQDTFLSLVSPKLQVQAYDFKVKSQSSKIVSSAIAASDYEEAKAYLVMDFDTGEVVAEKNSTDRVSIASLTKIATAMTALDLAEPTDNFKVSQAASVVEPTSIGVVPNESLNLSELLHALLMTSANDAAEVIKEGINAKYSGEIFIEAMNQKIKNLGITTTHFDNPQGYDSPDHYSSAHDIALIAHYTLTHYPLVSEIVKQSYHFLPADENHKQFDLYNWNGLIGVYPGAMGVKIGNTDEAGRTTIVLAERSGKKILVVVLGAPGTLERDFWAAELLDLGFEKAANLQPVNVTEEQLREKYSTWKFWN